jgi:hypothetical protein
MKKGFEIYGVNPLQPRIDYKNHYAIHLRLREGIGLILTAMTQHTLLLLHPQSGIR